MLSKSFVNLFNWNPQLFREIKGRFKIRNVAIAISASLLCQFLVMITFLEMLPKRYGAEFVPYNRYCVRAEVEKNIYCTAIDWSYWWLDIFKALSWIFLAVILIGGVYMLVADLAKEKRLGTLNFIRLSPQSSQKILLGKLLGVPILIYLAIAISLPLHLWANISSGLSLSWLFGFYGVLIAVCYFLYNASLLLAFLGVTQAWLIATVTGIFLLPIISIIQSYTDESYALIGTDRIRDLLIVSAIIILGLVLGSYWIWKAVNRRYRNPNATIISKEQSYWLMGCFHFYLLPLFLLINISNDEKSSYILWNSLIFFCTINLFWFLLVIASLSPQRQSVQDWARYRHEQIHNDETAIVKGLAISLKQDLIWGEKSPALVAIGINLVITGLIWSSWILLWHDNEIKLRAILTLILSLNLILIYAAIVQLVLLMKVKKPAIWAVGILGSLISLPLIALLLLSISPKNHSNLWLFSTFPWLSIDLNYPAIASILMAIIGQWSVLALVTLQLTRKIRKLGTSNSQKLLKAQKN